MKVLDIENVKIIGKNNKYIKGRNGQLILSKEYRDFKNMISLCCSKKMIEPPYMIVIDLEMYNDIDAPIQAILDGLTCIKDDRYIEELYIYKTPIKRGQLGKVSVICLHKDVKQEILK